MGQMLNYLNALYRQGILGPGKNIECDLPMDLYGKIDLIYTLVRKVAMRDGIGDVLSGGLARAAETWGRYQEDTDSGILALPNWGYSQHYDPRLEVEWSYGSILGDRDINEHSFNGHLYHMPNMAMRAKRDPLITADRAVEIIAAKVPPYAGDPFMFDYSEGPTNRYLL